jgi:four helix bundle protein
MTAAVTTPRTPIRSYEDIEAFKQAMALVRPVHVFALQLPEYERFDLASQIRRASKSVPANIAEGYGKRRSARHFKVYLENALGSTNEMIVHLQVAQTLAYGTAAVTDDLIERYRSVGRLHAARGTVALADARTLTLPLISHYAIAV